MDRPDVAFISADYGSYDPVKPALPQIGVNAEWVLVTDNPYADLELAGYGEPWRIIYDPRPDEAPFRAAKRPKFRPWEYTDAPVSIWVDGSLKCMSRHYASAVLKRMSDTPDLFNNRSPIAEYLHTCRTCLYEEATESAKFVKYQGEPLQEQADHYRSQGHPESWGLWTTSLIVRNHEGRDVKEMSLAWEEECNKWSSQDQVSQPFVLRNYGLRPATIPNYYLVSEWPKNTDWVSQHGPKHVQANQET